MESGFHCRFSSGYFKFISSLSNYLDSLASFCHYCKYQNVASKSPQSYTNSIWPRLYSTPYQMCLRLQPLIVWGDGRWHWQTPESALNNHEWTKIYDGMQIHPKSRNYDSKQGGRRFQDGFVDVVVVVFSLTRALKELSGSISDSWGLIHLSDKPNSSGFAL